MTSSPSSYLDERAAVSINPAPFSAASSTQYLLPTTPAPVSSEASQSSHNAPPLSSEEQSTTTETLQPSVAEPTREQPSEGVPQTSMDTPRTPQQSDFTSPQLPQTPLRSAILSQRSQTPSTRSGTPGISVKSVRGVPSHLALHVLTIATGTFLVPHTQCKQICITYEDAPIHRPEW